MIRQFTSILLLLSLIGVGFWQLSRLLEDLSRWPPDDFVEYWAAAKLLLGGRNPYDPAQLLPLQQLAGRDTTEAVMMWNPPWTLTAVLPLGLLPPRIAQLLWLLANLLAIGFCGDRLWVLYGGDQAKRWRGWLVAFLFIPTLLALNAGQISPLILLGVVLFLVAVTQEAFVWAGAATVLIAIKPHLSYLFWPALLADVLSRRHEGVILGGLLTATFATLIPLAFSPMVLGHYAEAMIHRPPEQWISPTLGSILRWFFGEDRFVLQFLPMAVGMAWLAWYWPRHRRNWNWKEQMPVILLVSYLTAPYGAWHFDLVLLLPAVMHLLLKPSSADCLLPRTAVWAGLLAVNVACLILNISRVESFWFIGIAPAIAGILLISQVKRSGAGVSTARPKDTHLPTALP